MIITTVVCYILAPAVVTDVTDKTTMAPNAPSMVILVTFVQTLCLIILFVVMNRTACFTVFLFFLLLLPVCHSGQIIL